MLVKLSKQNVRTKVIPEIRRPVRDWKVVQQQNFLFTDIKADAEIKRFIDKHLVGFDIEFANPDLKNYVNSNAKQGSDFFIITDKEFTKHSLKDIQRLIDEKMESATVGGYVSLLSYYLNWQDETVDKTYSDVLSVAIDQWIKKMPYNTENVSAVIDYPILKYERANYSPESHGLFEGKNFLFSHPNVRFWLWK